MPPIKTDVLIIGDGACSRLLQYFIKNANLSVLVVDQAVSRPTGSKNKPRLDKKTLLKNYGRKDFNACDLQGGGLNIWGGLMACADSSDFERPRGYTGPLLSALISQPDLEQLYNEVSESFGIPTPSEQELTHGLIAIPFFEVNTTKIDTLLDVDSENITNFKVASIRQSDAGLWVCKGTTGHDEHQITSKYIVVATGSFDTLNFIRALHFNRTHKHNGDHTKIRRVYNHPKLSDGYSILCEERSCSQLRRLFKRTGQEGGTTEQKNAAFDHLGIKIKDTITHKSSPCVKLDLVCEGRPPLLKIMKYCLKFLSLSIRGTTQYTQADYYRSKNFVRAMLRYTQQYYKNKINGQNNRLLLVLFSNYLDLLPNNERYITTSSSVDSFQMTLREKRDCFAFDCEANEIIDLQKQIIQYITKSGDYKVVRTKYSKKTSLISKSVDASHYLGGFEIISDIGSSAKKVAKWNTLNQQLEVVNYPNLFVLSGAVIPRLTSANPFLTLAALALRLSRHVKVLNQNDQ